jgi:hypothetical protein
MTDLPPDPLAGGIHDFGHRNYHNGRLAMLQARHDGYHAPILNMAGKVSEGRPCASSSSATAAPSRRDH